VIFYTKKEGLALGFTASKKVGNSPQRNFAKRRLKALVLKQCSKLKNGNYVFVAKKDIVTAKFADVQREFIYSLDRISK